MTYLGYPKVHSGWGPFLSARSGGSGEESHTGTTETGKSVRGGRRNPQMDARARRQLTVGQLVPPGYSIRALVAHNMRQRGTLQAKIALQSSGKL